jgi:pilus assembly protein CpaF
VGAYGQADFSAETKLMLREAVFDASLDYFLSPLREFLADDSVTEIMVNGFDQIFIERRGALHRTSARFESPDALLSAVQNIAQWVGREISQQRPVLDARLPNGSRVHAILPPAAKGGLYLTIRKFMRDLLTLDDLQRYGSVSPVAKEFLEIAVRLRKNIMISGGTGTGKTSLLNALSTAIPAEERVIVIEDTSELKLRQPHCLYLEAQNADGQGRGSVTVRQLFISSLRMRPDRIIVGEVRAGEALDMVQSMISGHAGSLSTVHASNPRDALIRLETLALMSDIEIPQPIARAQVAAAIHLVVQLTRFTDDGSRRITQIAEVCGLNEQHQYVVRELFRYRLQGRDANGKHIAELEPTGELPSFAQEPFQQGIEDQIRVSQALWSR